MSNPANISSFIDANDSFESWLGGQTQIVEADLDEKHKLMEEAEFPFLRATFFRWAQVFEALCPELAAAPAVLSVGDLHVENFGTWRDVDCRLVWGINDLDEAFPLPYTSDLVRLVASACLAIDTGRLKPKKTCALVLDGYRTGLQNGGKPFLLTEHKRLRLLAERQIKNAGKFYAKLEAADLVTEPAPAAAVHLLQESLPEPEMAYRLLHRRAGLGSLGRQRFVALADWRGGTVAREAKPVVLSACLWAKPELMPREVLAPTLLRQAVRCPDNALHFGQGWMVRRLAPDCVKIEVQARPKDDDKPLLRPEDIEDLLGVMGMETANIHLGTRGAREAVLADLEKRHASDSAWLYDAAATMLEQIRRDWKQWRKTRR